MTLTLAHASSLLADDLLAFEHSVALATHAHAPLYTIHALDASRHIEEMPEATQILERWGGGELTHHTIAHQGGEGAVETLLEALHMISPDLLILGKHPHTAIADSLRESVSEAVSRNIHIPSLIVPLHGKGFVDPRSGELHVARVLIPVQDLEVMEAVLSQALSLLDRLGLGGAALTLLHVNAEATSPASSLAIPPHLQRTDITLIEREGPVVRTIAQTAEALRADLVIMATHGHDSLLDVLRGSHTERVLRHLRVPALVIPL